MVNSSKRDIGTDANQPAAKPSAKAPAVSTRNCLARSGTETPVPRKAIERKPVNSTIPTPSLNSASPSIVVRSACGTLLRRKMARTATGSLGLISAANTSAQMSGT